MFNINLNRFINKFNLKILNLPKNVDPENYNFIASETTSGNLEIFIDVGVKEKIVILDDKINEIFQKIPTEKFLAGVKNLGKTNKVFIIGNDKINLKIIEIFKKENFIILKTNKTSTEIRYIIKPYLMKKTQKPERAHATMVIVYGIGVLLMGKSGIGKSEVALELLNKKHLFVGDDAIDIYRVFENLYGKSPRMTREFLEIRGIGIINVKKLLGVQITQPEFQIDLIIEFVEYSKNKVIDRLGNEITYKEIKGVKIPIIKLPILIGRNIAELVEVAVMNYKKRHFDNYIALDDLNNRIKENNLKK